MVHLGVVGNATEVLQLMLRHLTGIQGRQQQINANFTRMALLAGGAVTAMAGFSALRGLWEMAKAGKDLNEELLKTRQLTNMTPVQMAQARANDFRVAAETRVLAPSQVEKYTRDLITQLGDRPDAQKVVGEAVKAAYVVHNQTGENQEEVIKNLIKIADIRAKIFSVDPVTGKEYTDYKKLMPELQGAVNSLIISGGYMNSQKLLQLAQQGGLPAKGMTPEAFYAGAAEMAVSQGAARTGTALTSLFSQLIGGTMTKRTAVNMERAGLLQPGDWTSGRSGGVVVKPSGTNRFAGFQEDPIAWITGPGKVAIEKFAAQQNISMVAAVFQIFGRQTTQRLVGEAIQAGPQFARAREFFHGVADLQQLFKRLQDESVNAGIVDVQTAWKGFMEALADSPATVALLHQIAEAIRGLTSMVNAHPDAARYIVEATAIASAVAVVGGTFVALRAGISALAGPLRALAGPLSLLAGPAGASAAAVALGTLAAAVGRLARLALPAWLFSLGTGPAGPYDPAKSKEFNDKWVREHPGMPDAPLGPRHGHFDQTGNWVPNTPADARPAAGAPSSALSPPAAGTLPEMVIKPPAAAPTAPGWGWPSMAPRQAPGPPAAPSGEHGEQRSELGRESPERFASEVGKAVKQAMAGVGFYVDGKKLTTIVSDHQADQMSRAPTGSNSPDVRVGALHSGVGGNWALA